MRRSTTWSSCTPRVGGRVTAAHSPPGAQGHALQTVNQGTGHPKGRGESLSNHARIVPPQYPRSQVVYHYILCMLCASRRDTGCAAAQGARTLLCPDALTVECHRVES